LLLAFDNSYTSPACAATGCRGTPCGSIFYHFDKITEVYLAADYLKLRDGYKFAPTNGSPSQTEVGVGLRTRLAAQLTSEKASALPTIAAGDSMTTKALIALSMLVTAAAAVAQTDRTPASASGARGMTSGASPTGSGAGVGQPA
jgi:hypothetical protein